MEHPRADAHAVVYDRDGNHGVVNTQTLDQDKVIITFDHNRRVQVPTEMLQRREDDSYYLPLRLRELNSQVSGPMREDAPARGRVQGQDDVVIPVVEERLDVTKRRVEHGRLRIHKRVRETEEQVDVPLVHERAHVERRPIDQIVDRPVGSWYDGDTLVIPVLEEVIVVERRLLVREEVRVTLAREESRHQETVRLRKMDVTVERAEAQPAQA